MTARFVVRRGNGQLQAIPIGDSSLIGSSKDDNPVVDRESAAVVHARIGLSELGRFIEDAGGGSGTLVNGEPLSRRSLRHLDVVTVGANLHLVFLENRPAAKGELPLALAPRAAVEERTVVGARAGVTVPDLVPSLPGSAEGTVFFRRGSVELPIGVLQEQAGDRTVKGIFPPVVLPMDIESTEGSGAALDVTGIADAKRAPVPRFLGTVSGQTAPMAGADSGPAPPLAAASEMAGSVRPIIGVRLTGPAGIFDAPIGRSVVGRSVEATIRIDSKEVSRVHAVITVTPTEVMLEDQASANGTTVNGAATVGSRLLVEGDRVSFATFEFRVALVRMDGGE